MFCEVYLSNFLGKLLSYSHNCHTQTFMKGTFGKTGWSYNSSSCLEVTQTVGWKTSRHFFICPWGTSLKYRSAKVSKIWKRHGSTYRPCVTSAKRCSSIAILLVNVQIMTCNELLPDTIKNLSPRIARCEDLIHMIFMTIIKERRLTVCFPV